MRSIRAPRYRKPRSFERIVFLLLSGGVTLFLFPFFWMLSTSLKAGDEVFLYPPTILPAKLLFQNYLDIWDKAPFGTYFFNSIVVTSTITLGEVTTAALAAYAFSKIAFPGRDKLFLALLGTLMIPNVVTLVPAFVIVRKLNWVDSYLGLIVPQLATVYGIFMLRQFFLTIPAELDDAAQIDGLSRLGTLLRVYLPLSLPALAALAIISFINNWNNFFWPLVVTNSDEMRTVPIGLRFFIEGEGSGEWQYLMVAATLIIVPPLIVFLALQRYFVRGIAMTGIKG
jgi:ABC-type glycerol-3-phosphate transport system permease component